MPFPCRSDDILQRCEMGPPAQFLLGQGRGSHQAFGIARSPRSKFIEDLFPGDIFDDFQDFKIGKTDAMAEIVSGRLSLVEVIEGQNMSLCDVTHVEIITNAGSVRCRIIGPENGDPFP